MKTVALLLASLVVFPCISLAQRGDSITQQNAAWAQTFKGGEANAEQKARYEKMRKAGEADTMQRMVQRGEELALEVRLTTGARVTLSKDPDQLHGQIKAMEKFLDERKRAAQLAAAAAAKAERDREVAQEQLRQDIWALQRRLNQIR